MGRMPDKRSVHYQSYTLTVNLSDSIASILEGIDVSGYDEASFSITYNGSTTGNILRLQLQTGNLNADKDAIIFTDIPLETASGGVLDVTPLERQYTTLTANAGNDFEMPAFSLSTSDKQVRLLVAEDISGGGGALGTVTVRVLVSQFSA